MLLADGTSCQLMLFVLSLLPLLLHHGHSQAME
jgi:hypothetical protein